jgi:hypothetical protein
MRAYIDASVMALRTHFDVVAQSFKSEFRNQYDWTIATTNGLARRDDDLERSQLSLDKRVTSLEATVVGGGRKPKRPI